MKYALLKYRHSDNIGDEIQSLAAKQYLPQVDTFVERDDFCEVSLSEPTKLIANGWYSHDPSRWTRMDPNLRPLFVSMHCTPPFAEAFTSSASIDYLKQFEPIGCRDLYTAGLLTERGVDAYFTGCLTLTLKRRDAIKHGKIVISDAEYLREYIPEDLKKDVEFVNHTYTYTQRFRKKIENKFGISSFESRISCAEELLSLYCGARFVVTTRLHCALPCTAMSVPVLYTYGRETDERLTGLSDLVRCVLKSEVQSGSYKIPWREFPEPTKNHIELAQKLENTVRGFIEAPA